MSQQIHFRRIMAAILVLVLAFPISVWAFPVTQEKVPEGDATESVPTVSIQNSYLKTLSSNGGGFIIGTTGGDPSTPNDDNKRLLYGYPTNVGSSFSTLRIVNSNNTNDYRLGNTSWSSSGIAPITPPSSDGSTITTVWEREGIRAEERLYFTQNPDTGRLDTTAIEYRIKNNNASARQVGLRIMLDVMVGNNDGAPYFILGAGQVTQQAEWTGANVPEYWIAYESPTFAPTSLKGRGQLIGGSTVRPDRFVVADWPQASNTVWDYTVIPSDPVTNDSAVILYYYPASVQPGETRTYRTFNGIARTGGTAELELTGLEVTQAIQNWENQVVLIQDRPTFVRAHVRSTSGRINGVTAELIGRRGGSPLPGSPLQPANQGGSINVLEIPSRSALNDSFYFELPASWRNGSIELEFRGVNRNIDCRDHAGTDNDCKVEVTFTQSPAADVRLVGIKWKEGNTTHEPTWANLLETAQEMTSLFPIPRLNWDSPYTIEPVFLAGQPTAAWQFLRLNTMLAIQRTLDGCISAWPVNCKRYYVGILVDPPTSGVLGLASGIPSDIATSYLTSGFTPSHELGHSAGRRHTTCTGDEAGPDRNYPYPGGKISADNAGDGAFFGFDIATKRIYGPATGDLMSYCHPSWSSDWTYRHIRDHLVSRYEALPDDPLVLQAGDPAILVSGVITPTTNAGLLHPVLTVASPASVIAPTPGQYAIRLENSAGQPLAVYSFVPDFGYEECVGCDQTSADPFGTFAFLLPKNTNTARIVLLQGDQVLSSRSSSANAPSVTVVYPNGGEFLTGTSATLQWSANDPDGDRLEYTIQYSTDSGSTWTTLVSQWMSTSYALDLRNVAGTDYGLLRVMATDGFHTAQDQSNATFRVARSAPRVSIQAPADNSLYVANQTLVLEGSAIDNEDGQLGDSALRWSSNQNGHLGAGRSVAVNASTLVEGTHTITLSAQDSDGQISSASLVVRIYRTRPALPASLSLAPTTLGFVTTQDSGQTAWQSISIRNDGDGQMTWSASANQTWIRVSSLSGTAPTDILVAANPTGLASGEYTGQVTVIASGASNSPQVVQVTLQVQQTRRVFLPVVMR